MKTHRFLWIVALAALATMVGTYSFADSTSRETGGTSIVKVGAEPVDFSLEDLDGKVVNFADLKGKEAVMLVFWSLFCGPCQEELPLVDAIAKKYKGKGLGVYTINLDGPRRGKAVKKFMSRNEFTFNVLWEDIQGSSYVTADAYGILGTPSMIIVGKNTGKVTYVHVGQTNEADMEKAAQGAMND